MSEEFSGFATRLMEKMAEKGMTQADLCRSTGLATSMISHYCTEQRTPSVPVAVKIARALGTTVDYLASGESEKAKQKKKGAQAVALLDKLNSLNAQGQAKAKSYIEDLLEIEKYTNT